MGNIIIKTMWKVALLLVAVSSPIALGWTSPNPARTVVKNGRREFFGIIGGIGSIALVPNSSSAAAVSQEQKDKENIVKGYKRLQYLLDNWEKETTVCKIGHLFQASMAFVSSWGEANPGGGKDRVQLFIERSKKNVIASRDSLKTVIDILNL